MTFKTDMLQLQLRVVAAGSQKGHFVLRVCLKITRRSQHGLLSCFTYTEHDTPQFLSTCPTRTAFLDQDIVSLNSASLQTSWEKNLLSAFALPSS